MKQSTGYLYKDKDAQKWVARVTYTDEAGKRRNVKRYCETKTEARIKLDELRRTISERGEQAIDGDKLKFREVAERYEKTKLIEPVYVGEKKVAGMRSLYVPKLYLKKLVEHFGNKRARSITHADIEAFKLARLKTKTRGGTARSIAAVNRELETLLSGCVSLNRAEKKFWSSQILQNGFGKEFCHRPDMVSNSSGHHRSPIFVFFLFAPDPASQAEMGLDKMVVSK